MSRIFYTWIWNLSEWSGIGLGRFAPYVFQQMIGGYKMEKVDKKITDDRAREEAADEYCKDKQYEHQPSCIRGFIAGSEWQSKRKADRVKILVEALEFYADKKFWEDISDNYWGREAKSALEKYHENM